MLADLPSTAQDSPASILFVDDEANVLKALRRLFHNEQYVTYFAESGPAGLEILRQNPVDLIISDMRMPAMNGAEFFTRVVEQWPKTIRILLTGYADLQSTIDAINNGRISNYCNKPWNDEELKLLVRNTLEQKYIREERDRLSEIVYQQNMALKELNEQLEEKVEQRTALLNNAMLHLDEANANLKKQFTDSIRAFSRIIEMRPGIKSGHSKYIADNAYAIGKRMGMNEAENKQLVFAGLLLQLGKMTLSDEILEKPLNSLNREQLPRYLRHAQETGVLLKGLTQLEPAINLIHYQYEHYDGSGVPEGLKGNQIPLGSRILAVIRDYITYLEGNVTGQPMSVMEVRKYLLQQKIKYYDPEVVEEFLQHLDKNSQFTNDRPIIELSWTQLEVGMDIEEVSYEGQLYLKNCILTERMLNSIINLHRNQKISPLIKVRIGTPVTRCKN
ncbi:HD domain-containing phosphohydrolase [Methylomicrobium sp. RS1]|jgi:response regulator RpfG family c-di-GMP phosphodiesterase|uniref:HD domain-containing phosphohydrolase n=1 Tax=Candidatus Methylomicrobium oryzae TaxID=2802053 RepID=UPI0019230F03|nr:HD domain-containing phosphohydrolase [Methylomicrobium sp. RS1]MBL1264720.1 response regulator [Methylomicrobium sp. RS1]